MTRGYKKIWQKMILSLVVLFLVAPLVARTCVGECLSKEENVDAEINTALPTNIQKFEERSASAGVGSEYSKQPFGEVIAYIKEVSGATEIHTMSATGSNDQVLFNGVIPQGLLYPMLCPRFSPDGAEITFYAWKGLYSQIWRVKNDGSNPGLVFNCADWLQQFPNGNVSCPSFSYDRTKIVFTFDPGPEPAQDSWPIVTYADGSYFWRISEGGQYFVYSPTDYRIAAEGATVSPAGTGIYLAPSDTPEWSASSPGPSWSLLISPGDGYPSWYNYLKPLDWSPDGTKLLCRDWWWPVGVSFATGYYALWLVDISNPTNPSPVFGYTPGEGYYGYTNENNVILQASFSPDGTKVVFDLSDGLDVSGMGKDFDVYTINVDGSDLTKITNDKKSAMPTWNVRRGAIRGYIYTPDGIPVINADIATDIKSTTKTDEKGEFVLESLPWDNYNITVSKNGYLTQTFQVSLNSSAVTQNFTLSVTNPGNITGKVYMEGNTTTIPNATVSTCLGSYAVKTDSTGAYTISGVAPNPYNITANATGYRYQMSCATVGAGGTETCDIYLRALTTANWTYICYLDGDNNLCDAGDSDYLEMQSVGSTDSVNIVVLKDNDKSGDTKLLVPNISGATSTQIPLRHINTALSLEADMGSYQTLADFVLWAIEKYPAQHYALDLWDHGGGYIGMCWDDISGTHISIPDLKCAMTAITNELGRPVDVLVHDSCLMAELEADYNVKAYADFIVHSEETVPGDGIPYHSQCSGDILGRLKSNPHWTPEQFAIDIVSEYGKRYAAGNPQSDGKQTYSAVNTTRVDDGLARAVNNFAQKLKHVANTYWSQINSSMYQTETYEYQELIDLYDFASRIKASIGDSGVQQAAQWVMDNVSSCVIAEWHGNNHSSSHGLTIFFPWSYNAYTQRVSDYSPLYMTTESKWNDFLQAFYNKQNYANTEPTCTIITPSDNQTVSQGAVITISGTASDAADGISEVQIKIDRGDWIDAAGTTNWSYDWSAVSVAEGCHRIYARALDNKALDIAKDYSSYQCVVVNVIANMPPVITYLLPLALSIEINETEAVVFNVTAHDQDAIGFALTYQWYLNETPIFGANTNAYTFTTNYDSAGIYNITVQVSDGFSNASHSWTVKVNNKNRAPVITQPGTQNAYENQTFSLPINASDPDGDTLTFSDDSTLFDVNATTGLISFTPNYESAGIYWIKITVTDGEWITWQTFELTIINVNRATVIASFSPGVAPTINEGENITFNITAYDPDGTIPTIEWRLDGFGVATGNPYMFTAYTFIANYTSSGVHVINVTVSDGEATAYHQWTLTVIEVPPTAVVLNEPTTMTTTTITITWSECKEGDFMNYTVYISTAQDVLGNAISAIQDNKTTYYTATGLSPNATYYFTVIVYDSSNLYNNSNQVSGKTLVVNHPPQITSFNPSTDEIINESELIMFNVNASDLDGTTPIVEWRVNGILVATGNSYMLVTNYTSSGTYTINVTITDGEYYVYHQWLLTVADVNVITSTGGTIAFETILLDIPSNAVSANTTITITPISVTPPSGCSAIGNAYRVETIITTFTTPITITLSYNTADLPEGVSEDDLAIWMREDGAWERLGGTVNKINKTVSAQVTSLSDFAIFYEIKKGEAQAGIPWALIGGTIGAIIIIILAIVIKSRCRGMKQGGGRRGAPMPYTPYTPSPYTPVPDTKFCVSCGVKIPRSARVCPECGTRQE